jgi:hypothetical protein
MKIESLFFVCVGLRFIDSVWIEINIYLRLTPSSWLSLPDIAVVLLY